MRAVSKAPTTRPPLRPRRHRLAVRPQACCRPPLSPGGALLRWALFEAAQCAARRSSPDHAYYLQVANRIDHNRACLSVARKLCRRAHHILRELGDDALAPTGRPLRTRLVDAAA